MYPTVKFSYLGLSLFFSLRMHVCKRTRGGYKLLVNVFKCFPVEEPERKPSIFLLIGSGMCIFFLSSFKTKEKKSYEEEERKKMTS